VSSKNADSELSAKKYPQLGQQSTGPAGKRTASDGFNPINQYQAPKAPTGLSKGKSGRVVEKCVLVRPKTQNL